MTIIRSKWQTWLQRRFEVDEETKLGQRNIFVFLQSEGYLYSVLIMITFIAGINYANNLVLALCFLLMSMLILSFLLAFKQLYGLKLTIICPKIGQAGQTMAIKLNLQPKINQFHLHLRCEYLYQYKKVTVLKESQSIEFAYIPPHRGLIQLPRLNFYSVYPFGLVKAWSYIYPKRKIWISPKPIAVNLSDFVFFVPTEQMQSGIEDFSHLRKFNTGDHVGRIVWQQYAKGRGLLIKQFEQQTPNQLQFDYRKMTALHHEEKLSQLMYLVEHAYQQQNAFRLILPTQQLILGLGEQHYQQACLMLAQEP